MKKKLLILLLALVAIATTAKAQVVLNETNFPDANFRAALASILGISEGDEITEAKIAATTYLNISSQKIADLTGIEYFTAMKYLYCYNKPLTALDVSKNTALTALRCYRNQLTSLDVSKNTKLTSLFCYMNQLTSLDVSKNTALTELWCHGNQLTDLDVSKNTALTKLGCDNNQLTDLDVSKNSALTELGCDNNQLTALDVSKNTALKSLYCGGNQLTDLDVSKNTALEYLECYRNQLTSLDVSKNTALTWLSCFNNQLNSLDVSKNTALTSLNCFSNLIKGEAMDALVASLPMTEDGKFYVIDTKDENEGNVCTKTQVAVAKGKGWTVYDNNGGKRPSPEYEGSDDAAGKLLLNAENFPDANFRAELAKILRISEGDEITEAKIAATTSIYVYKSWDTPAEEKIANLTGIEHFTALTWLSCYNNQLTSLDVSKNTALTVLLCYYNQLTALDVSKNTALTFLDCGGNQLTALDVLKNTALTYLSCGNNQLASLDVSKNTALTELYCYNNQIKGEAMDALVASLPTVENGEIHVINTKDENEGNVCTKSQVAVAKGKGWTVYDNNGGSKQEYEGSDNTTAIDASLNDNGKMTNDNYYSIDGVKLKGEPTKKGIYIRNGKKVVK